MLGTVLPSQYNPVKPEGTPTANLSSKKFNTQIVHLPTQASYHTSRIPKTDTFRLS